MASKVSEQTMEGLSQTGAEAGAGKDEVGATVEVEGAEVGRAQDEGASDLLPLALRGPRKVTVRSSRFHIYLFFN